MVLITVPNKIYRHSIHCFHGNTKLWCHCNINLLIDKVPYIVTFSIFLLGKQLQFLNYSINNNQDNQILNGLLVHFLHTDFIMLDGSNKHWTILMSANPQHMSMHTKSKTVLIKVISLFPILFLIFLKRKTVCELKF